MWEFLEIRGHHIDPRQLGSSSRSWCSIMSLGTAALLKTPGEGPQELSACRYRSIPSRESYEPEDPVCRMIAS